MHESPQVVWFDDGHPRIPDGAIFYPLSLSLIRNQLGELISDRMASPRYFNANIEWILGQIVVSSKIFTDVTSAPRRYTRHTGSRDTNTVFIFALSHLVVADFTLKTMACGMGKTCFRAKTTEVVSLCATL
jgi:hypothetical protein